MSRWRRRVLGALALLLLLAGVAALWWRAVPRASATPHALRPDDAALVAQGQRIYAQHCARCHGARGEGQPNWRERGDDGLLPAPPHDASGHTWHHPDSVLIRITRDGVAAVAGDPNYRTAMPVYRGLMSDEDIVAVLSWIKSRWPSDVRAKHDQINAQSR